MTRKRLFVLAAAFVFLTGVGTIGTSVVAPVSVAQAAEGDPVQVDPEPPVLVTMPEENEDSLPGPGGETMPGADEALPDDFVPSYYMYTVGTGQYGPCTPNKVGNYVGVWTNKLYTHTSSSVSPNTIWHYQTKYKSEVKTSNNKYTYYVERGFNTANKYFGCANGGPVNRYYGERKVSRLKTLTQVCWSGGCNAGAWSLGTWKNGWIV